MKEASERTVTDRNHAMNGVIEKWSKPMKNYFRFGKFIPSCALPICAVFLESGYRYMEVMHGT